MANIRKISIKNFSIREVLHKPNGLNEFQSYQWDLTDKEPYPEKVNQRRKILGLEPLPIEKLMKEEKELSNFSWPKKTISTFKKLGETLKNYNDWFESEAAKKDPELEEIKEQLKYIAQSGNLILPKNYNQYFEWLLKFKPEWQEYDYVEEPLPPVTYNLVLDLSREFIKTFTGNDHSIKLADKDSVNNKFNKEDGREVFNLDKYLSLPNEQKATYTASGIFDTIDDIGSFPFPKLPTINEKIESLRNKHENIPHTVNYFENNWSPNNPLHEFYRDEILRRIKEEFSIPSGKDPVKSKKKKKPQNLFEVWRGEELEKGKKYYYDDIIEILKQEAPGLGGRSFIDENNKWFEVGNTGYVQYLAGFYFSCMGKGWINKELSSSELSTITKNTFFISPDPKPFKSLFTNPPSKEKYLKPFENLRSNLPK